MLSSTSLEFAHGTSQPGSSAEEIEKMIVGLFPPSDLLAAYRMGLQRYGTSDLVLVAAQHDPEIISAWPRRKYIESALSRCTPNQLSTIRLVGESAHQVAQAPVDYVAFWLVLEVKQLPVPIMTVLYTVPYEITATAN